MALSKTYIRPVKPNNIRDMLRERECNHSDTETLSAPNLTAFTPGFLVAKVGANIVRATQEHYGYPVEIVWTDGSRADATKIKLDGSEVTRYTTLMTRGLVCDVASTLFTADPVETDFLILPDETDTADHGKITPVTDTQLDTALSNVSGSSPHGASPTEAAGLLIGRVEQVESLVSGGVTFHRVVFF